MLNQARCTCTESVILRMRQVSEPVMNECKESEVIVLSDDEFEDIRDDTSSVTESDDESSSSLVSLLYTWVYFSVSKRVVGYHNAYK